MAKGASSCVVGFDPRVELIEGLAVAAGGRAGDRNPAVEAARAALPKKHDAVKLFASMTRADWRHRTPAMILMDFSAPPALEIVAHKDHYANFGKEDALSRLLPALRDYAALPAVKAYLGGLEKAHAKDLARVRETVEKAAYAKPVEQYLGLPLPHRYFWIVSPLVQGMNGQNVLYRRPDKICDIYSMSSLSDALAAGVKDFQDTAWHEICHTVVDDWTHANGPAVDAHAGLYKLMEGRAKTEYQGPPGWRHMVDEHVIRSTCARLAALARGEEHGKRAMEDERTDGFVLIGSFYEALRRYEGARKTYKTLGEYYPELVKLLETLSSRSSRPR